MPVYTFSGRILPERIPLTLPRHMRTLNRMDGSDFGTLDVDITVGQISAILRVTELLPNLATARTVVREFCLVPVNAFTFCNGVGYEVEITKGICLDTNETETFGVSSLSFVKFVQTNCQIDPETVLTACDSRPGRLLQYALEDISDALRGGGRNRAFLCYRSIEALRNFVAETASTEERDRNAVWELLRDQTNSARSDIDFVKSFADDVRHGGSTEYDEAQSQRMLETVWLMLHKVIENAGNIE